MKIHFTERGIVAFTTLVCCTTLISTGHDSIIGYSLLAVIAGFFGLEVTLPRIRKK